MTEPTRDPRLLTAEQLAMLDRLTAEYYRQGVGAVSHWTSIVVRDLLAHIAAQEFKLALREGECDGKAKLLAAQDQRHAALVSRLQDLEWCVRIAQDLAYEATNHEGDMLVDGRETSVFAVGDVFRVALGGKRLHEYEPDDEDYFPPLLLPSECGALAQPPGDE